MRILQCSDAYLPFPGGVSEHLYHLTRALRDRGHEVWVLTANYPGAEPEEGVVRVGRIRVLPALKLLNMTQLTMTRFSAREVRGVVRGRRWDVVHTHGPLAPNLPRAALRLSLSANVATFHTDFVGFNWNKLGKFLFHRDARRIHIAIGVSKIAVDAMRPYRGLRWRIVPNGVDTGRFSPELPQMPDIAKLKGPKVLYVGRMEPRKGFPRLAAAWPLVKREVPDAWLIAVGKGPNLEEYKAMVREFRDSVIFTGFVPDEDLPRYYATCDLYTSPAVGGETFGIVLIEAMAAGTPVVASRIRGYDQVINHGENGLLVDTQDPKAYASAIVRVLRDKALWQRLREGGLRSARFYSWANVARMVEEVYLEALELKGATPG